MIVRLLKKAKKKNRPGIVPQLCAEEKPSPPQTEAAAAAVFPFIDFNLFNREKLSINRRANS